jgi:hypothetical protein
MCYPIVTARNGFVSSYSYSWNQSTRSFHTGLLDISDPGGVAGGR